MPMLADPKLDVFKRFRVFDDFENQPLHGTFLIDAQGNVRFQRISADPFLDVEFIKTEAARVGKMKESKQKQRCPRTGRMNWPPHARDIWPCPSWITSILLLPLDGTGSRSTSTGRGPSPTH